MKYKDLTRYEQERFKNIGELCVICGNHINRKYDDIVFTKERKGKFRVYKFSHEKCVKG